MKITKKVFDDLAIYMIGLGVLIGFLFPFFSVFLSVPTEIAFTFNYFISCILAGILLGLLNILLARKTVGTLIRQLSQKMKHFERILTNKKNGISEEKFTSETCLIKMESEDEFGECADSFNNLVITLAEVLETHKEILIFSEMLTSHLELNLLASETLSHLIKYSNANGGAILIEKGGELKIEAIDSIKGYKSLENNKQILHTIKTLERQLIEFPNEILLDGIEVDFRPKELFIEPIVYKNISLGVLILVNESNFSTNALDKISFYNQSISLAFRNAITHNQMQQLAAEDSLTGIYNRRFGMLRMAEEFSRSVRLRIPITLLMFDLDHFKNVNDTYGHLVGDKVLINIAKIALAAIRTGDVLLRYGGEEFMCILPDANKNEALIIAERIRTMVMDSSIKNEEQDVKVTISIGLVTCPHDDISNVNTLIQMADEAMYKAKDSGRNCILPYSNEPFSVN